MDKKIKLVSYSIMQTLILLASFLIIVLALKHNFSIIPLMLILLCTQLFLFVFLFNDFFNKKK